MAPSFPSYSGTRYDCDYDKDRTPPSPHTEDKYHRVQPTNNPYHWEVPVAAIRDVSTWVKASWSRTNHIVRQPTDGSTLKRNTAIRRSGKGRTAPDTGSRRRPAAKTTFAIIQDDTNRHNRPLLKLQVHRRFSFEVGEPYEFLRIPLEECGEEEEEAPALSNITCVGLEVKRDPTDRCTRFREELEERPYVTRTFAEILGEPFVPTGLAKDESHPVGSRML